MDSELEGEKRGAPVGGVEALEVELDARLGHEHLRDRLEEEDAIGFGADVVVDVGGLVVPRDEPVEAVGDELEVWVAEVLHAYDARIAEGTHALGEV